MKAILTTCIALCIGAIGLADSAHAVRFQHKASKGTKLTCTKIISISTLSNVLYKDANLHGGRGRSLLDQGHRFGGARRLSVAGSNKTIIGCFGLYACDQPYGCRYYQATCGDSASNSQFIAKAKANGGNTTVLVGTGSGTCLSFNATASRQGSVKK